MARNGIENIVSIRDERGRYLKGIAGGPGRPAGCRNKLTKRSHGIFPQMRSLPMASNGSENSVAIRDEHGRYLKGIAGGPGRPAGSRNKLTEEFLGDLHAAWHEHGREAIDRVVAERPEVFLAIMAKMIDVRRVEVGQPEEFSRRYTKEAIIEKIEQKAGPRARQLFEKFISEVEKLEAEQKQEQEQEQAMQGDGD
jgi:hypothetical protein